MKTIGVFEHKGYSKDYYVNGKYIGTHKSDFEKREYGYAGRVSETIKVDMIFANKKKIKAGTIAITEFNPICGRIIKNK